MSFWPEHVWIDISRLDSQDREFFCSECGARGIEIHLYQGGTSILVDAATEPNDAA
jgi:hypothetical protein